MKLLHFTIATIVIYIGTLLFINGYYYESGTTCFWLVIAVLTWPSVQKQTNGKAWHLLGWFHLHLIPLFLIAHVIGSHFKFWLYESTYTLSIPGTIPVIGGIPVFEFLFYTIFTGAVIGLYSFTAELFHSAPEKPKYHRLVKVAVVTIWILTIMLITGNPNRERTTFPFWFSIMFVSSIPFSLAVVDIPPFSKWFSFVPQTCCQKPFVAFCMLLLPLMAFWEWSAVQHGLWVYNKAMTLSSVVTLTANGSRQWPLAQIYGHVNTAIFIFLITLYRNMRRDSAENN